MIELKNNNTELSYDKYVKNGSIMCLREGLDFHNPNHLYNYLKQSQILKDAGVRPEDFGIFHPVAEQYKDKTTEELISDITELIIENRNLQNYINFH